MQKESLADIITDKINSFALLDSRVRNLIINCSEGKDALDIKIEFENFMVQISYSYLGKTYGYRFAENEEPAGCLNTEFLFPFSSIAYSIYDVHNAVDDREFVNLEFHTLNSNESAADAADTVISFIQRHIDELNLCDDDVKNALEDSFKNGIEIASRRYNYEDLKNNPKKLEKHKANLYSLRYENPFYAFLAHGKVHQLQIWLAKKSAKGKLLTFEKRYYDYLMENGFKADNPKLSERLKKESKNQLRRSLLYYGFTLAAFIFSMLICLVCDFAAGELFYKDYLRVFDFNMFFSIRMILLTVSIEILLHPVMVKLVGEEAVLPVDKIIVEKRKIACPISAAVAVILICAEVLSCSKCIALGENNVYLCKSAGKAQYVQYSDIKLFTADGWDDDDGFEEDKMYIAVINDDYNNYYDISRDRKDIDDIERLINKNLKVTKAYKSVQDFQEEYCDN